jgi:HK97 gp10 family phage protein
MRADLSLVAEKLKKAGEGAVREKVFEELARGGERICEDAKKRVPVRTGDLKQSLKVRRYKKSLAVAVEADYPKTAKYRKGKGSKKSPGGSRVYYAFAVEYGTRKDPAQPFLGPALEANEDAIEERLLDAVEEALL